MQLTIADLRPSLPELEEALNDDKDAIVLVEQAGPAWRHLTRSRALPRRWCAQPSRSGALSARSRTPSRPCCRCLLIRVSLVRSQRGHPMTIGCFWIHRPTVARHKLNIGSSFRRHCPVFSSMPRPISVRCRHTASAAEGSGRQDVVDPRLLPTAEASAARSGSGTVRVGPFADGPNDDHNVAAAQAISIETPSIFFAPH